MKARKETGRTRRLRSALLLLLVLALLPLQALGLEAQARFGHGGKAIVWPIAFEDSYFDLPGSSYRQDLATASLGMALSAFRKSGAPLEQSHLNIQAYLQELGFEKLEFSQYGQSPSIDTIATAIAQKPLPSGTVIAIAISGGGYKDEWQSNFTIGDSLHHSGFDSAAWQVLERVKAYRQKHGLKGPEVKLWISGFSRAAATANRLGALLQDEKLVSPAQLYDYTFATPNVTKQKNAGSYPSIYNIVGAFDPVPMVPLRDWGFDRFGQSFVLPAPQLNSDYSRRVAPVSAVHQKHTGGPYWSNFSGASAVGKLLGSLSENIRNTQDYTKKLQPLLMDLWQKRSKPVNMFTSFLSYVTLRESSMRSVLNKLFSIVSNSVGESMLQSEGVYAGQWKEDKSLKDNLAREHFPEGYLAWMSAYHSLDAMRSPNPSYRQVGLQGIEGVRVLDARGGVAAVYELPTEPGYKEGENKSLWFSQEGDELVISLPGDQDYSLRITAAKAPFATVRVKEGRAGFTRMRVYDTGPMVLRAGEPWFLKLPAMDGKEKPGASRYELGGEQGRQALAWQPNAGALSSRELSSSFATMFKQNLFTLLAVLLLVVILVLFSILLLIRAARRRQYKRRLHRAGTPLHRAPFMSNFLSQAERGKRRLKLTAFLLLCSAAYLSLSALRLTMSLAEELNLVQHRLLYLYSLLYGLPVLALHLGAALPALGSSLYALLWLKDKYLLRTCRLYALIALLFSLSLALVLLLPAYMIFQRRILVAAGIQLLLLLILLHILRGILRHPHKGHPKGGHLHEGHLNEGQPQGEHMHEGQPHEGHPHDRRDSGASNPAAGGSAEERKGMLPSTREQVPSKE